MTPLTSFAWKACRRHIKCLLHIICLISTTNTTATPASFNFVSQNQDPQQHKMSLRMDRFLHRWHGMLGLSRQSPPSWYRDRIREELRERRAATTRWEELSETSDIFFCIIRAQNDGVPLRKLPPFIASRHTSVYVYMLAKYTLRWQFYRVTALLCCAPHYKSVREVVNPSKDHKLEEVACRHHIDAVTFKRVASKLRRIWPLLP